jgi:hypothetical protein
MRGPRHLTTLQVSTACYGDSFALYLLLSTDVNGELKHKHILDIHFTAIASQTSEQFPYICASAERISKEETYVKTRSIRSSRARNKSAEYKRKTDSTVRAPQLPQRGNSTVVISLCVLGLNSNIFH